MRKMISFVNFVSLASICVGFDLRTLHGYFLTGEVKPRKSLWLVGQQTLSKFYCEQQTC